MSNFNKVKTFMETFGQEVKTKPSFSTDKINSLRYDLIIEIFTKIFPMLKNLLDLWVDAPQYLSLGTFILPILSNSFLNFID